jgi:hypothetical protein
MFVIRAMQKYYPIENLLLTSTNSKQKIDIAAQKVFIENYYTQYAISKGLRWCMLGTVSWSLFQYVLRHNASSALTWLKIAAIVGATWFIRGNDPERLAKKAYQAIEDNKPEQAIAFIQKGAGLDQMLTVTKGSGQLIPFFPFYWYPGTPVSLLEKAVLHNCVKVCSHLINIGFNLNRTRALNMTDDLNTMELLIENGMPADIDTNAFYCLEPYNWDSLDWWLGALIQAVKNKESEQEIIKFFKIINFLRKNGAINVREDMSAARILIKLIDKIPLGTEEQALRSVQPPSKLSLLQQIESLPSV